MNTRIVNRSGTTRPDPFGTALAEEQKLTQRFLERAEDLDPEWRNAGALDTYSLTVTFPQAVDTPASPRRR